jgi:hypothetical protein
MKVMKHRIDVATGYQLRFSTIAVNGTTEQVKRQPAYSKVTIEGYETSGIFEMKPGDRFLIYYHLPQDLPELVSVLLCKRTEVLANAKSYRIQLQTSCLQFRVCLLLQIALKIELEFDS